MRQDESETMRRRVAEFEMGASTCATCAKVLMRTERG